MELKRWEYFLFAVAACIFVSSATVYVSGVSLRKYVLGWQDEEGSEQIGKLSVKVGHIRRQLSTESEFKSIEQDSALYNFDTLVTGPEGSATVLLSDGSSIELSANTMVRLIFESRLALSGIARAAKVDVVAGKVSGQSKKVPIVLRSGGQTIAISKEGNDTIRVAPPVLKKPDLKSVALAPKDPAPPSIEKFKADTVLAPEAKPPVVPQAVVIPIQLLGPKMGEHFQVQKSNTRVEVPVTLNWSGPMDAAEIELTIRSLTEDEEIFQGKVTSQNGKGTYQFKAQAPGEYEWSIKNSDTPVRSKFIVDAEFEAFEFMPILVGGRKTDSNQFEGEHLTDFNMTFQWKPATTPIAKSLSDTDAFRLKITDTHNHKTVLVDRKIDGSQYVLDQGKISTFNFDYFVAANLSSGFIATSPHQSFVFRFLPPRLTLPVDDASLSTANLKENHNSLLLTWQKMNFTSGYEIEISQDPGFAKTTYKHRVPENFYVFKAPAQGRYWWRVRSVAKNVISPTGKERKFTITP